MSDLSDLSGEEGAHALPLAQELALASLLDNGSLNQAAKAAGVSLATLRRWRNGDGADSEAFREAYRAARLELLGKSTAKLRKGAELAVDTLTELLALGQRPEVRISAARSILSLAYKSAELEELAERQDEQETELERLRESVKRRRETRR